MKKSIALMLALLLTLSLAVSVIVNAETYHTEPEGKWWYVKEGTIGKIAMYDGPEEEIAVPNLIMGNLIDGIYKNFIFYTNLNYPNTNIKRIDLGNIKYIDEKAFQNSSLTSIKFPAYFYSAGSESFASSLDLAEIDFSETVEMTTLSYKMFYYCLSLTSVVIDGSITTIDSDAFDRCENLKHLVLSDNVSNVHARAFNRVENLETISTGYRVTDLSIFTKSSTGVSNLGENFREIKIHCASASIPEGLFDKCSEDLVIYGWRSSTAATYAAANGIEFIPFDPLPTEKTTEETTTIEETTIEEATIEETTVEETTIEETTIEDTTIEETTIEETTIEDTTIEETTVEDTTIEETTIANPTLYMLGDVTNDDNVNIKDVTAILRYIVALSSFSEHQKVLGNVNGDGDGGYYSGNTDILDVTEIQKWIVKLPANAEIGTKIIDFGNEELVIIKG